MLVSTVQWSDQLYVYLDPLPLGPPQNGHIVEKFEITLEKKNDQVNLTTPYCLGPPSVKKKMQGATNHSSPKSHLPNMSSST